MTASARSIWQDRRVLDGLSNAQWAGASFIVLGVALIVAMLVRKAVPVLGKLYIPSSVIAGFLLILLGPQVLGALTGGWSLLADPIVAVLHTLPGLLINIVFAGIMLGKKLPSVGAIWKDAAPHVLLGASYCFGQLALGGLAVALILGPLFGLPDIAGSIIEMSFAGGHGTVAGVGEFFDQAGHPDMVDVGLALATVSMITGTLGGFALVNWALRSPRVDVARKHTTHTSTASSIGEIPPNQGDQAGDVGLNAISRAFGAITVAIIVGWGIQTGLAAIANLFGSAVFDHFPLFPFTLIGGFGVQLVLSGTKHESLVERTTVNSVTGLALDLLVAAAIGTLSLAAVGANWPSILILTVLAFAWSVVGMLWLGPRFFTAHWFDRAIPNFGQSQGNVATGFVLAEMTDPDHTTGAAQGFGYRQLFLAPLLGGGLLTALSVPIVNQIGSLWFGLATLVLTGAVICWGVARTRRARAAG